MTYNEFIEKYGDVKVKFSSYYKYIFTFRAVLPNDSILTVSVGGDSSDIYRMEVNANDEDTVRSLEPYAGAVYNNGKEFESFYEY